MKITRLEVLVTGDGPEIDRDPVGVPLTVPGDGGFVRAPFTFHAGPPLSSGLTVGHRPRPRKKRAAPRRDRLYTGNPLTQTVPFAAQR